MFLKRNLTLKYGVCSDVGAVRESNQDSAYAGRNFLLVADGMGGHAGGDVASTITVTMLAPLDKLATPKHPFNTYLNVKEATTAFEKALLQVYLAISEAVYYNEDLGGMGTTVSALLRSNDVFISAHLGDSRIYLLHEGHLKQVTTDHTFVQQLVDSGKISEEDAKHHPQKNVVVRVLGDFDVDISPDLNFLPVHKGDRYLLCSDGVSGSLDDDILHHVLSTTVDSNEAAQKLVSMAIEAGSTDNCTAIVADVVENKRQNAIPTTPIFAGAAHERLQEHLQEVVDKSINSEKLKEPSGVQKVSKRVGQEIPPSGEFPVVMQPVAQNWPTPAPEQEMAAQTTEEMTATDTDEIPIVQTLPTVQSERNRSFFARLKGLGSRNDADN
jgi:serine/threonine protein phosphatase PrpC